MNIFLLKANQWEYGVSFFFIKKIGKIPENGVIRKSIHEECEFISPIFFEKPPRSFRQILNLERLNKFLLHMHFKRWRQ